MRIVGGKFRGKKLLAPSHQGTRPTSDRTRETIFNILLHNPTLGPQVLINKVVLDVFAGTGALGLEALSRGAKSVTFVENEKEALMLLYENIKSFDLPSSSVLAQDGRHLRGPLDLSFDLVFIDPPYRKGLILPTLLSLSTQAWLSEGAVVVMEMAKNDSFILPSFLSLVVERSSGATTILFCVFHCQ